MESESKAFRVEFPDFSCSILQKLNQQRQRGQLCDIIVSIGGHQYRAHRAVLAASSPYFCDQVLLKNSARVVLPDVMHPCVFERLLQSCYTGALTLPAGEVVAFLTAASFLQMWHVVDKCTELLEEGGVQCGGALTHKISSVAGTGLADQHMSPDDDSYHGEGAGEDTSSDALEGNGAFVRTPGHRDSGEIEQLLEESFSPPGLDLGGQTAACCSPPIEREVSGSEDGDTDHEFHYTKPAYVQPSIMGHRKWVQVKAERPTRADCSGLFGVETASMDSEHLSLSKSQGTSSTHSVEDRAEEKLVSKLDESLNGDRTYEDPFDFYGTSMEGFSNDKTASPMMTKDDLVGGASSGGAAASGTGGGGGEGEDGPEAGSDLQEETSHSGFTSVVYKLYTCQCGKSFSHKSQRNRHMSMHLGLRPYSCSICGKSFKMKHHLVGHMKIHTGIKPYECSLCSKRFMWRDSFNRHTSSCTKAHQAKRAAAEQPTQIC
ncbi:zinc finger and BTB domain-containing protein 43 [Denticeps clupeoides]|uniref:Zinc finger and BTB domain-containing protein 43 n=1 Tax=Denticeps clupeoides TaxID=299321 RepID=A0AAY4EBF3_9TELE|nr:zinc finger and BTB domain-containing protein 43 [Denticeps clupeoides]XP_028828809.1 zinc finger and BTB domain-containing protein 43 [Denticeps clupeoides]